MSRRRKHLTLAMDQADARPPAAGESIVRALGARGGNVVEVERADGARTLVLMPAKFNKKLWVRRGGYLVVDESEEAQADGGSRCVERRTAVPSSGGGGRRRLCACFVHRGGGGCLAAFACSS